MNMEFPNISQAYTGYKSRYCYITCHDVIEKGKVPDNQMERDNVFYDRFIKYDV